jgi:hypothetical protein
MAQARLARYIQGVRVYCPTCEKQITPITYIYNNINNMTTHISFECDVCHSEVKLSE